jgi:hypothetical protein
MKIEALKFMTISELNAIFKGEAVAKKIVDKIALRNQEPRPRTEAEKRRAMQVGRLALMIAADRKL